MLTLEKFEEASEVVKKVTSETKLIYSDYFSSITGNKVRTGECCNINGIVLFRAKECFYYFNFKMYILPYFSAVSALSLPAIFK